MNFQHKGTFESKRVNNIYEYGVYGKTVKHRLYAGDKKERYFHLYHSISKESAERAGIENRLNQMTLYLKKYQNKVKEFGPGFEKYFNLHYDEKTQAFVLPELSYNSASFPDFSSPLSASYTSYSAVSSPQTQQRS